MISAEEIKALMVNFEYCKIDYAKPYSDVDSGELFNHAWKMSEAIRTLQTLLNQAAEGLGIYRDAICSIRREALNSPFEMKMEWLVDECTDLINATQQTLAAIETYIVKEGE